MIRLAAIVLIALAAGSLRFWDFKITFGVLLGGALSFANLYWLRISIESLLEKAAEGKKPNFNVAFYVLRYAVIVIAVFAAVSFNAVSVAATLIGLLSFAFAILLEAFIQVYFIVVNREED